MKKRLLLAFMAMSAAVSGYALERGEFVYTPQGRFQITGANVNANNAFQDLSGWTVVSASTEKTLTDNFNINANGYAEGINSVASLDATEGEGMYFKFEPSDASTAYVVSYKMKGATAVSTRVKTVAVSTNLAKVEGNSDNAFGGTNDVLVANTAEELTEDWQTFNYAIVGDGTPRTYFISFTGMATNIEIADVQIAPAMQFADLRQRDAMLEKLKIYKNCYAWPEGLLDDFSMNETISNLEAIGDESGQATLDEALGTAQEVLDEFIKANMDDFLPDGAYTATTNGAGTPKVDIKFSNWLAKVQKAITWGDWNCLPEGRGFWENANQGCADLGHFQSAAKWNNGSPDSPMGVYTQKNLDPGSYVFGIESRACLREPKKNDWSDEDGLKPAYGVAYIVKIVDGQEAPDTIASAVKGLNSTTMSQLFVTAEIKEAGKYEIGFKAYCKDTHKDLAQGSVTYIRNASIFGKTENQYSQKQLGYEADVREQITTGRTQLTTAKENIANADYLWGKAELQACVDSVETKIAAYELMDQDAIIATFEDDYAKSTTEETGYLVYTIYQAAVKDIIAANKKFIAVNDTLASIQVAIDRAEATLSNRLYNAATGMDALQSAITKAKGIQAQMKAGQYSEENAAAIVAANAELAEAVELFKTTVPAEAITVLADIDFATPAVENTEANNWSIAGTVNSIILPNYGDDAAANTFAQGYFENGEKQMADVLRVGNGEAIVEIPEEQQVAGTNILKLDFDYYIGNLNKKNAGFYLYSNDGNADSTIAAFYFSRYDNAVVENTFGLDYGSSYIPGIGDRNNSDLAICVEKNRTHFEVVLDYGEKTMYCSTSANGKSQTSEKLNFNGAKVVKFGVKSDYNVAARRCWFDNLKIQCVKAGEATGITEVNAAAKVKAPTKVLKNGRIIINGKYAINGMLVK